MDSMAMAKVHPSLEIKSNRCAAGLKTLLVEYLPMQNRHLAEDEKKPKSREQILKVNVGKLFWLACVAPCDRIPSE